MTEGEWKSSDMEAAEKIAVDFTEVSNSEVQFLLRSTVTR